MNLDFLIPLENEVLETINSYSEQSLAHTIQIHTEEKGLPDISNVSVAILGVVEGRAAVNNDTTGYGLSSVRECFYKLFPGNWGLNIVDLGNVPQGNTLNDTYFVLKEAIA
ncbi:arginase, partial [Bacteroidota bacterium]